MTSLVLSTIWWVAFVSYCKELHGLFEGEILPIDDVIVILEAEKRMKFHEKRVLQFSPPFLKFVLTFSLFRTNFSDLLEWRIELSNWNENPKEDTWTGLWTNKKEKPWKNVLTFSLVVWIYRCAFGFFYFSQYVNVAMWLPRKLFPSNSSRILFQFFLFLLFFSCFYRCSCTVSMERLSISRVYGHFFFYLPFTFEEWRHTDWFPFFGMLLACECLIQNCGVTFQPHDLQRKSSVQQKNLFFLSSFYSFLFFIRKLLFASIGW